MKRFLALLILLFVPALARANSCQNVGTCTAAAPCAWSANATWSGCGGTTPQAADTVVLYPSNSAVTYDMDDQTIAAISGSGFLIYDTNTSDRGADGLRTLTVAGDAVFYGTAGSALSGLIMRKNDRLLFDTTAAKRTLTFQSGALLDFQGDVYQTTLSSVAVANATATCSSVGKEFTLTLASGGSHATVGGRVIFQSGAAMDRQLEIRAVSGNSVTVCSDYADGATGRQRLTAHSSLARTFPAAKHSVPSMENNSACSAGGTPYPWCTGVGTGSAVAAYPAVGDQVAVVTDWIIGQTGGTQGWRIVNFDVVATNWPMMRAGNISGLSNVGSAYGIKVEAANQSITHSGQSFMNYHDNGTAIGMVGYIGALGTTWEWNAFHDDLNTSSDGSPAMSIVTSSGGLVVSGTHVDHNILYRTAGPLVQAGTASYAYQSTVGTAKWNLIYDGTLASVGGSSFGIKVGNFSFFEVAYNAMYYAEAGDFPDADGGKTGTKTTTMHAIDFASVLPQTSAGSVAHHNWIVNFMGTPLGISSSDSGISQLAATANYISHTSGDAVSEYAMYGNLIRDTGLLGNGEGFCSNPTVKAAKSNYCLGVEPSIANSADCTVRGCNRIGLKPATATFNGSGKITMSDNIIAAPYSNFKVLTTGNNSIGACFVEASGGASPTMDVDYLHNTCDGRSYAYNIVADENVNCIGAGNPISCCSGAGAGTCGPLNPDFTLYGEWLIGNCNGGACTRTVNVQDFVVLGTNNVNAVNCNPNVAGQTRTLGKIYRKVSGNTANQTATVAGNDCASQTGGVTAAYEIGYLASTSGDYNLRPSSPALTAAADGTAIGVRAFRFDRDRISGQFGGALTFDGEQPANVCNTTAANCQDQDGDGVIDMNDNCIYTFNPSQYDGDGDGKGDACDATP